MGVYVKEPRIQRNSGSILGSLEVQPRAAGVAKKGQQEAKPAKELGIVAERSPGGLQKD